MLVQKSKGPLPPDQAVVDVARRTSDQTIAPLRAATPLLIRERCRALMETGRLTYSTAERLLRQNRYASPTGATKIANDQHMAMVKTFTISINSAFTKKTLLPMM